MRGGCALDARAATTTAVTMGETGWGGSRRTPGPASDTDDIADSPGAPSAPLLGGPTRALPQRAALNQRYAVTGVVLLAIACGGFYSAISARLSTGVWYRDPLLVRSKPIPTERLGPLVALHALTGCAWLALVTVQVLSIAMSRSAPRAGEPDAGSPGAVDGSAVGSWWLQLHRAVGRRSLPAATAFALSALVLVVVGRVRGGADPEGGYNTWFVRWVEFGAVALSWFFYLNGIAYARLKDNLYERYPHLGLTPALCVSRHKDCMLGSLFFAAVPTGLPRLVRDVLQMRAGIGGCNYADSATLFFGFACVACVLGLPVMMWYLGGRAQLRLYSPFLAWYAVVVIGSFVLLRPDLTLHCPVV